MVIQHMICLFCREVVNTYLMKYKDIRKPTIPRNKAVERRVPANVRFDGFYHYQDTTTKNQRCAVCKKSTTRGCKRCTVGLHDHCFKEWHSKNGTLMNKLFLRYYPMPDYSGKGDKVNL